MASKGQERRKKSLRVLENAHGAMGCYLYMTLCIVVAVIVTCGGLLLAEKLFPRYVHIFNYSLSSRTFVELKAAHKYKAAADFYEQKHEIFTTKGDKFINMIEVFDCYKRIGEYEKAEGILNDALSYKYLTDKEIEELESESWMVAFFKFGIEKEFFNLYEEMGDTDDQKKHYLKMKEHLTPSVLSELEDHEEYIDLNVGVTLNKILEYYDIKMQYLEFPDNALSSMRDYINKLLDDESQNTHGASFIIRCMNLYNNWMIKQHGVMPAYTSICTEVDYADKTDSYNHDKSDYGTLSDICYRVHDIKNSERFYRIYSQYLTENSSELDPLFIQNTVRGFKYLESAEDWSKLEKNVIDCCEHLRELLSKNIYTMSESQREHFVSLIDIPFDYALNLLYEHPSNSLASTCFENSIFAKGLLMRSSREIANKIRNNGDSLLVAKYDELQEYRKELAYRDGLGQVGNAIRMSNLKRKIEEIDKELAISCSEYRSEEDRISATAKSLSKSVSINSAAIEFVQTGSGNLMALVLTHDGNLAPINIGSLLDAQNIISADYRQTYSNPKFTEFIWSSIEKGLADIDEIYYSSTGIFNSIAFPALYSGNREHLTDKYNFHLLSNIGNLAYMRDDHEQVGKNLSLAIWGDVDYGNSNEASHVVVSPYRDIERGQGLQHLIYSGAEVDAISAIAREGSSPVSMFKGSDATESSFRLRSGKGDRVLHVSTHGFFEEDDEHRVNYNPMYNAGLLFAGADSTWNKVDTVFVEASMIDDGILRADEIQYLDFSNCSLTVLSACKTGLGQSSSAEGVYGLQRAFKLAGVDEILMSLWNVDDRCTSELMTIFYRKVYEGESYADALREAQSAIRTEYPSPEYWGAFVLLY